MKESIFSLNSINLHRETSLLFVVCLSVVDIPTVWFGELVVECAKSLYDEYVPIGRRKGEWEPAPIEIVTIWRDDL